MLILILIDVYSYKSINLTNILLTLDMSRNRYYCSVSTINDSTSCIFPYVSICPNVGTTISIY